MLLLAQQLVHISGGAHLILSGCFLNLTVITEPMSCVLLLLYKYLCQYVYSVWC